MGRPRVVAAFLQLDQVVSPDDGFSDRYRRMISVLAETADVTVVVLIREGQRSESADVITGPHVAVRCVRAGEGRVSRIGRATAVLRALAGLPSTRTLRMLAKAIAAEQPDLLMISAQGHLAAQHGELMRRVPTLLLAEEDLSVLPQISRPASLAGRALHRLEEFAFARRMPPVRGVVVISANEVEWARRTFRTANVAVVPASVDLERWSPSDSSGGGRDGVLAVGHFDVRRNYEGLLDVVRALEGRPGWEGHVLRVISATPPPMLADLPSFVEYLGPVADPRPYYESSAVCLVPSLSVSGVKSTILQGWAMGCPVVASAASARSVHGVHGEDLLCAPDGDGMAGVVLDLLSSPTLSARLSEAGRKSLLERHSPEAVTTAFRQVARLALVGGSLG